ncbi:hypothetical protein BJ684DRAFT_18830 [Piptocephalis cylindrospora]|uniref:Uncharacterized protein n=1 Tax=Piptocephalis cylindrospora TaxID=1907219 RepID=A0A4P9Y6Q1_9FUNG|nr:hypothetical protein BJ684DRAFT_18830 [Piptocephalis cylindrospora]|eukprot:RKP14786.1 hypothetical protein BJ684DRAFT_18830 [Piptocephalis cylindrospora]
MSGPQQIIEKQRFFQAPTHTPLFLRGPRDKVLFALFSGSILVGLGLSSTGLVQMIRGKK